MVNRRSITLLKGPWHGLIVFGQEGSRALHEAVSLAPHNDKVKEAFLHIHSEDHIHILYRLCSKFVFEQDSQAGKDAVVYLAKLKHVPADVAEECFSLVSKGRNIHERDIQDGIISGLLRESSAARASLASQLQESITAVFEGVYRVGDGSANALAAVLLDKTAWPGESIRNACEKDAFQLFLAQLMGGHHELDGRALGGISRLLITDANKLHGIIDEDAFGAILGRLDNKFPVEVRSQATLATVKYLEATEASGQPILSKFITTRLSRHRLEDVILAFSVAAAIFPLVPSMASAFFLSDGFLPSLIPLISENFKSEKAEQAALDMLNAACVDTACREAIRKHCTSWLKHVKDTEGDLRSGSAAVILAKVQGPPANSSGANKEKAGGSDEGVDGLMPLFKQMMVEKDESHKQSAIEGIAYATVQPKVKEQLSNDRAFLESIFLTLCNGQASSSIVFGALTVIDNLTRYLPILSEEQKRISQLKAYANASKASTKPDLLDEDAAVTKRCIAVVNAGAVSALAGISKNLSSSSIRTVLNILLSLSRTSSHRGIIAQQGGVKMLLQWYTSTSGQTAPEAQNRRTAAHALARILISVDPSLVFTSSSPPLTSAIRPLLSLLTEDLEHDAEGPRNLLPIFEALLALTNLASVPSPEAAEMICRLAFPTIEDLMLGNNVMIQRASTELVCNLVTCPSGIEAFADESKAAARRLHILLALADVEDEATRRASGGVLATITEFESAVKGVIARDRGVEILIGLCEDEDESISHRGIVCLRNLAWTDGPTGDKAKGKIRELRGIKILKSILQESKNRAVLELGVEALKALM